MRYENICGVCLFTCNVRLYSVVRVLANTCTKLHSSTKHWMYCIGHWDVIITHHWYGVCSISSDYCSAMSNREYLYTCLKLRLMSASVWAANYFLQQSWKPRLAACRYDTRGSQSYSRVHFLPLLANGHWRTKGSVTHEISYTHRRNQVEITEKSQQKSEITAKTQKSFWNQAGNQKS